MPGRPEIRAVALRPPRYARVRPSALTRRASTSSSASSARRSPSTRAARPAARTRPRRRPRRRLDGRSRAAACRQQEVQRVRQHVLPAPVSPVSTFRPGPRRSSARSISRRFSTRSRGAREGLPVGADGRRVLAPQSRRVGTDASGGDLDALLREPAGRNARAAGDRTTRPGDWASVLSVARTRLDVLTRRHFAGSGGRPRGPPPVRAGGVIDRQLVAGATTSARAVSEWVAMSHTTKPSSSRPARAAVGQV